MRSLKLHNFFNKRPAKSLWFLQIKQTKICFSQNWPLIDYKMDGLYPRFTRWAATQKLCTGRGQVLWYFKQLSTILATGFGPRFEHKKLKPLLDDHKSGEKVFLFYFSLGAPSRARRHVMLIDFSQLVEKLCRSGSGKFPRLEVWG